MTESAAPRSGGQVLVDALAIHGVDTVFCVPGEIEDEEGRGHGVDR